MLERTNDVDDGDVRQAAPPSYDRHRINTWQT